MTPHVVFVLKYAKLLFFLQQLSNTHPVRRPLLLAKDHANSGWVNPFCQMVTSFYAQHAAISSLPATILHIWKKQTKKTPFTTMWWNRCYSKHHMEMWLNNMFIFVLGTVCFFFTFHNPVKSQNSQREFQICNTLKLFNLDVYSKVSGRFRTLKSYWYWRVCFQQRNDGWLGPNGNTQLCNRKTSTKGQINTEISLNAFKENPSSLYPQFNLCIFFKIIHKGSCDIFKILGKKSNSGS